MRVADVGTGSGAVAIALAVNRPNVEVWATDTSAEAVELARANAERLGVADRVHVVQGDLLEPLTEPVDLVVANLPYLPEGQPDPRYDDEPPEAIYAPGDGLDPYRDCSTPAATASSQTGRHDPDPVPPRAARGGLLAARGPARSSSKPPRRLASMERREVVFVDGVRTAFGRAGPQGSLLEDARRRHGRQGRARAAAAQPGDPARADRRRHLRRDRAGRRPGTDARPRRRAARRHPAVRARLRGRPHVRRRAHRGHGRRGRDRARRVRHRPRRRRRAHGPPPDGRGRRLQSALRRPSASSTRRP